MVQALTGRIESDLVLVGSSRHEDYSRWLSSEAFLATSLQGLWTLGLGMGSNSNVGSRP